MGRSPKPPADAATFERRVERALEDALAHGWSTYEERVKCLAVAVRWAAVKAHLVLPGHGSAFEIDEDDDEKGA